MKIISFVKNMATDKKHPEVTKILEVLFCVKI
jgi:hypothetical protein